MYNRYKTGSFIAAFAFVFGLFAMFSTQASAQLWFGGGLVYGESIGNIGLQANGHLVVNEENKLRIGADITYYFTDSASAGDTKIETSLFTINVNGHYMLVTSEVLVMYAIGGLNFGFVSVDASGPASEFLGLIDTSDTEIGLNVGGGLEYTVPFGRVYAELKYILGGFDQLVIGAGVRIPISGG